MFLKIFINELSQRKKKGETMNKFIFICSGVTNCVFVNELEILGNARKITNNIFLFIKHFFFSGKFSRGNMFLEVFL